MALAGVVPGERWGGKPYCKRQQRENPMSVDSRERGVAEREGERARE